MVCLADKLAIAGKIDDQALGVSYVPNAGVSSRDVAHVSSGTEVGKPSSESWCYVSSKFGLCGGLVFADQAEMLRFESKLQLLPG